MKTIPLLKDVIYSRIYNMITTGILPMGSKLSESVLMEKLNATKSPIRDAMKRLEAEKLIMIKPKSGTFVFCVTAQELYELLEFRYCLESNAIQLAHKQHQINVLSQNLRLILDKMDMCYRTAQINEYLNLDSEFHNTIIHGSNNDYYMEAYKLISARMAAIRVHLGSNEEHMQRSHIQHQRIIAALEQGDIEQANHELLQHISLDHGAYWRVENIHKK